MQLCRSMSASSSAAVAVVALASTPTFSSSRRSLLAPLLPQRRKSNSSRSSNKSGRSGVCAPVAVFTGIVQGTATVSSVERRTGGGSISSSSSSSSPSPSSSSTESAKFTLAFPPGALAGVTAGGSIAINGTCLTVVTADEAASVSTFDVVGETLRVTSLGRLEPGSRANFERAARVGDEIGGHLVSGHVCCVARVEEVERQGSGGGDGDGGSGSGNDENNNQNDSGNVRMRFRVPARWGKYILPKGFISLDGCSLTVGPDVVTEKKKGAGNSNGDDDDDESTTLFSVFFIPETLRVTRFGEAKVGDAINVEVDATTQAVVDAVERVVDVRIEERLAALRA